MLSDNSSQASVGGAVPQQTEEGLSRWLAQELRVPYLDQTQIQNYLDRLVSNLINDSGFSIPSLIVARHDLLRAVNRQLTKIHAESVAREFQALLDKPGAITASFARTFRFESNRYPEREPMYRGRRHFHKHYYPQISDLKSSGEEFDCAVAINSHKHVRHWVRNVQKDERFSFWLPTSTDYFYPDFVCELVDGRLLVIEYKGDLRVPEDTTEKERIGELWARTSGGKCLFLMAYKERNGMDVTAQINAAIGT